MKEQVIKFLSSPAGVGAAERAAAIVPMMLTHLTAELELEATRKFDDVKDEAERERLEDRRDRRISRSVSYLFNIFHQLADQDMVLGEPRSAEDHAQIAASLKRAEQGFLDEVQGEPKMAEAVKAMREMLAVHEDMSKFIAHRACQLIVVIMSESDECVTRPVTAEGLKAAFTAGEVADAFAESATATIH